MPREDYLLRYFNEFAKFIAIVMGLRKKGLYHEAEDKIRVFVTEHFPIEITKLLDTPENELISLMKEQGLSLTEINMLADLLYEYALSRKEIGTQSESIQALKKAKTLLTFVVENDQVYSFSRNLKLETITKVINKKD